MLRWPNWIRQDRSKFWIGGSNPSRSATRNPLAAALNLPVSADKAK